MSFPLRRLSSERRRCSTGRATELHGMGAYAVWCVLMQQQKSSCDFPTTKIASYPGPGVLLFQREISSKFLTLLQGLGNTGRKCPCLHLPRL